MPEPHRIKTRTKPTEMVISPATVRQESGSDGLVWVEKSDELCDMQHMRDCTVAHAHRKVNSTWDTVSCHGYISTNIS